MKSVLFLDPIPNPNPSVQNITIDISRILHRYCNFNGQMIFVDVFTLFIQSKLVTPCRNHRSFLQNCGSYI